MERNDYQLAGHAERVGIGEARIGGRGDCLRATLGSCVGLCLVWPERRRFVLVHVLLPESAAARRPGPATRFADTAVPFALSALDLPRRRPTGLVAFVAGGAAMCTGRDQQHQVGAENVAQLLRALKRAEVPIAGRDLGGAAARQLVVDGPSASVVSIRYGEEASSRRWELAAPIASAA